MACVVLRALAVTHDPLAHLQAHDDPIVVPWQLCYRLDTTATRGSDPYCPQCVQLADIEFTQNGAAVAVSRTFQTPGASGIVCFVSSGNGV